MNSQGLSIDEILHEALQRPSPAERDRFLDLACEGNSRLRARVEKLLAAQPHLNSFLEAPAVDPAPTIDHPPAEAVGTLIGPYKLLEQIGEGGMGLVYMAEQQRPVRRLVALKIIKPGMDSRQVIARFEAERQALAMMDHPNIARILDAGTVGEGTRGQEPVAGNQADSSLAPGPRLLAPSASRPYFVMELVRGIPITEFCDHKKLNVRERLELFIQVCQAVQHAHQKGIIHRDLKPTNVLVTMHDAVAMPKVIDFGIAKALGQSLTDHTLQTGFAQLIGTPLYMSPEQAELNAFGVDTRSDVYSLGVLLYELLTGTTPFDKDRLKSAGFDEMRRIIREEEPETVSMRLSKTRTNTPGVDARVNRRVHAALPELDWIVAKSLDKDRTRRYESPSSLAADIQRYLNGELVQACPPSTSYRFRKFARKNRATLTAAAIIAASLLLGTGISVWQAIRATAAEAQATANEAKAKTEEQKALAAAAAEAAQRKQAEKNFEAALEAVDRMLAHLNDEELNDVPRVGPLRRKILKDAIAFYQRIPLQSADSIETRYRVATTWHRIAEFGREANAPDDASLAYKSAITSLTQIIAEQPQRNSYRATLARVHHDTGWFYLHEVHDLQAAEKNFRISSEYFAAIANADRKPQASALSGRGIALGALGKRDEAMDCFRRALDLLSRSQPDHLQQRAVVLQNMANLTRSYDQAESIDLYRRAIAEYRQYLSESKASHFERGVFASLLDDAAVNIARRNSDEAENLWKESITIRKSAYAASPRIRVHLLMLVRALRNYSEHLRRVSGGGAAAGDEIARQVAKGGTLFQDAIRSQRELVSRFALSEDRYSLIQMLQEETQHLLGPLAAASAAQQDPSARKLQADALLTEAIQLSRALAAEFPDDATYRDRLAALLKLQAQHFGPPATETKP